MADLYEMPTPKPPSDLELDVLDSSAVGSLLRVDVPPEIRRLIRDQRDAIRRLRIKVAKTEAERDSIKAIADIARDERVVRECPGSIGGSG